MPRHQDQKKGKLRDVSDRLLRDLEELKALEREKRGEPISSPQFNRLARVIEIKSRDIWELASDERAFGEQIEGGEPDAVDDVEPNGSGR